MIGREKRVLLRHYLEQGMNKAAIARELEISRRTVYHWIRTGQLDRELDDRVGCHSLDWPLPPGYSCPMGVPDLLQQHRAEVLRLAAKYGATDVRVFGSVARGEADDASDIDFLVRMAPGRSLFDLGGLLMDLQDLLGRRVDVVTERGLRSRVREQVLGEAIQV
jgi:uncharacterized protein